MIIILDGVQSESTDHASEDTGTTKSDPTDATTAAAVCADTHTDLAALHFALAMSDDDDDAVGDDEDTAAGGVFDDASWLGDALGCVGGSYFEAWCVFCTLCLKSLLPKRCHLLSVRHMIHEVTHTTLLGSPVQSCGHNSGLPFELVLGVEDPTGDNEDTDTERSTFGTGVE